MSPPSSARTLSRREVGLALLAALLLAAWPFRRALLDPGTVLFSVDTATVQLPWSAAEGGEPPAPGPRAARNPDLADQGVQFYPFYRWVARSWLAGDPPTWCPLVYAGAPGFGNAQSGALDPQVGFLVLLEALGGRALFDYGLGLAAWLRVAAALLGAFLLARRLGLERAPAALAAATFGFSGFLLLWLGHALGHVPPLLPWVLLALEGTRGPRPCLAAVGTALALWLAILGGHVETAFYIGAAGGLWALAILREDRRAGWLGLFGLLLGTLGAAPVLLPTLEYLGLSAARYVRELDAEHARHTLDVVSLGLVLALGGIGAAVARLVENAGGEPDPEGEEAPLRAWIPAALGLALACGGVALVLGARGLDVGARLALVPDVLGKPGADALGYRGAGTYTEEASAWIAFPALALAVAAALSPGGALRRKTLALALGGVAFLLAIRLPGLLELYRFLPFVGLGATVRLAPVAALFLGLVAGDALQRATPRTRAARFAAACALLPLVAGALVVRGPAPLASEVPVAAEEDELVGFALTPPRALAGEDSPLEGWLVDAVPLERARLVLERIDPHGVPIAGTRVRVPLMFFDAPSERARREAPARVAAAPEGARFFRTPFAKTSILPDGHWRFTVEFLGDTGDEAVAARVAGVSTLARPARRDPWTLGFLVLGLAALLVPALGPRARWVVALLAAAHGLHFARGLNPAVPRAECFPSTRTEELLAREQGVHRFLGDPGVLPPNTGLVRGLRAIDGYDAIDPLEFNLFRAYALQPGANPLLTWNARGVDLDSPAFRLYGVKHLVLREPLDHPGWELVAAPGMEGEARAETWIYRATEPLPRAFCVPRVVTLDELGALHATDPRGWSPLALASVDGDWRPARPYTRATVGEPTITNREVRVTVELDGDGLLVVTEQAFPGWKAFVDGEERALLTADMIFRGVPLEAGRHEVVLRYAPASIRIGTWLAVLGGIAALALALRGVRPAGPRGEPAESAASP